MAGNHLIIDSKGVFKRSHVTVTDEKLIIQTKIIFRAQKKREVPVELIDFIEIPALSDENTVTFTDLHKIIYVPCITVAAALMPRMVLGSSLRFDEPIFWIVAAPFFITVNFIKAQVNSRHRLYVMARGERIPAWSAIPCTPTRRFSNPKVSSVW